MNLFKSVFSNRPKSSAFDLSHERKLTCNCAGLIPILCEEVIPGDKFRMNTEVLLRMAPMLAPVMHRVNVFTHFFFIPNRIIWEDWEDFITGGQDGSLAPVLPYLLIDHAENTTRIGSGTLADHLGVASMDTGVPNYRISALPFRAYRKVYEDYYRDQNVHTTLYDMYGSGEDTNFYALERRCWEKDYFTSCLPWTQRGGDVTLPITGDVTLKSPSTGDANILRNAVTGQPVAGAVSGNVTDGHLLTAALETQIDPNGSLEVSSGTATIEDLRRATKLQQWLERNARGGSRYIEQMFAHFGVRSSDSRLQRPEYLGGGKTPVVISEVLQSSESATTPQGTMAGHGVGVGRSHGFSKRFEEHGIVLGILSVMPRSAYMQGTRRLFKKSDKLDFAWPEFAQLGEQPVFNDELYSTFDSISAADLTTFGYQSRYAEYKFIPDSVHGDFKTNLDYWHMARKFSAAPSLNGNFVNADPTHRIFAVEDSSINKLYVQLYHSIKAVRPLPYNNIPSL